MVEFRPIVSSAPLPADADWALIERARGKVAAKGGLTRRGAAFGPALFADLPSAIDALTIWAAENQVAVIYIRTRPEPSRAVDELGRRRKITLPRRPRLGLKVLAANRFRKERG